MADPPAGGPEPPPTNTQESITSFSVEDFQPRISTDAAQIIGKRTRNGEAYTPAEGIGRITTREVWKLIDSLKDIIHQVKHDQNVLQEQNEKLYEEVRALRMNGTASESVVGIGTTKTGYVIQFKDTESAEAARYNTEWLNELGNNTKLVKPRFGVVVHRTPTEDFDLENANSDAIKKIMEENDLIGQGYRIKEVAWRKRKDKVLGKFASLGIWLDSAEGAEFILSNGLLRGRAKKHRAVAIVRANISANDAYRECEPGASTAMLNIMKSGPRMEALVNDHQSQNLDVLLIQEPSVTTYRTYVNHSVWRLYRLTVEADTVRFRSLIYMNRNLSTSSHRQVLCDHPDITAIKIWTAESQILIFSVYIAPVLLFVLGGASAEPALTVIQNIISNTTRDDRRPTGIILAGDFNRHYPTWGDNHIPPRFIEDVTELVNFF
ncbi:uncharacterized protein N7477_008989 [Penicillium maclennaniae]|uniref:uncharacterized protein n=1 Tax=Penicillium maclennaniae TaxID=1343394 RepID=UPI002540B243|nr:uncharacterized protein N7477_008989 [Penicillium maclennaniae]KAJ5666541.1 hypothetical protein N7477_008989 [Penicillium maclennaniae]